MIITQTPLRISFGGGGTDFPDYYKNQGGLVLSSTIDKYIYVMVKKRFDDEIVAHYSKLERVDNPDELKHGLIREALKLVEIDKGIEISTTADIPSTGSGLGSSSSVTVGVLHALHAYKGELPTREELVEEACNIEIDILEGPIGKQDQYAAVFGGLNLIRFLRKYFGVTVKKVVIDEHTSRRLNQNLMLFYTGIAKDSKDILSEQKRTMVQRGKILQEMKETAEAMTKSLYDGTLGDFARLLDWGWTLKKKMTSRITTKKIDEMYKKAISAGASGGKICGSGGGGFLLIYCPVAIQNSVRGALSAFRELPFNLTEEGTKVIFDTGR